MREYQAGLVHQGLSLQQQGWIAEAEACYRKALETDPHYVDPNHLLGVLKAQEGKAEEALRRIEMALHRAPTSALLLMNYGNILSEIGRDSEALARFDQAVALNPQLYLAWTRACFNRALELRPGFVRGRVARCMAELPVLYADGAEIDRRRAAYSVLLQALALAADQNPREYANAIDAIPPFFLPR